MADATNNGAVLEGNSQLSVAHGLNERRASSVSAVREVRDCIVGGRVRRWFAGLSPEERSIATGICDSAFLLTMVELSTPMGSPASRDKTVFKAQNSGIPVAEPVDWYKTVSIEEIARTYSANLCGLPGKGASFLDTRLDHAPPVDSTICSTREPTEPVRFGRAEDPSISFVSARREEARMHNSKTPIELELSENSRSKVKIQEQRKQANGFRISPVRGTEMESIGSNEAKAEEAEAIPKSTKLHGEGFKYSGRGARNFAVPERILAKRRVEKSVCSPGHGNADSEENLTPNAAELRTSSSLQLKPQHKKQSPTEAGKAGEQCKLSGSAFMELVRVVFPTSYDFALRISDVASDGYPEVFQSIIYSSRGQAMECLEPLTVQGKTFFTMLDIPFLDSVDGAEMLHLLDNVAATGLYESGQACGTEETRVFLSDRSCRLFSTVSSGSISDLPLLLLWLEELREESKKKGRCFAIQPVVPLCVLFLARVEVSIYEAYLKHTKMESFSLRGTSSARVLQLGDEGVNGDDSILHPKRESKECRCNIEHPSASRDNEGSYANEAEEFEIVASESMHPALRELSARGSRETKAARHGTTRLSKVFPQLSVRERVDVGGFPDHLMRSKSCLYPCSSTKLARLPLVISTSRALRTHGETQDEAAFETVISPVVKMLPSAYQSRSCELLSGITLDQLLLTPLSWLLHREAGRRPAPVRAWNDAIKSSLELVKDDIERFRGELLTQCVDWSGSIRKVESTIALSEEKLVDAIGNNLQRNSTRALHRGLNSPIKSEGHQHAPSVTLARKTKKKKKKKKRKGPNVDAVVHKQAWTDDSITTMKDNQRSDSLSASCREESIASISIAAKETNVTTAADDSDDLSAQTYPTDDSFTTAARKGEAAACLMDINESVGISHGGISLSRVHGVGTTCVVVALSDSDAVRSADLHFACNGGVAAEDVHAHAEWEKVEGKCRGSKTKKLIDADRNTSVHNVRNSSHRARAGLSPSAYKNMHVESSQEYSCVSSRRMRSGRNSSGRRRNANRKVARDIVSSILDSVDDEVRSRRNQISDALVRERTKAWGEKKVGPVVECHQKGPKASCEGGLPSRNQATLRDVVLGMQSRDCAKNLQSAKQSAVHGDDSNRTPAIYKGSEMDSIFVAPLKENDKNSNVRGRTQHPSTAADQNTAATVPETLSGVSANTQWTANTHGDNGSYLSSRTHAAVGVCTEGDSSSSGADEFPKESCRSSSDIAGKDAPPPLPTLLGPGNSNSASSSVASSLEAPHGTRHHSSSNENDVGYHLLDVCDRLSRDMSVFMGRRAIALNARRRERGALLSALQDTVSKLWSGHCHVEMYGSCATQLDLPSSDLDVVICGLETTRDVRVGGGIGSQNATVKNQIRRCNSDHGYDPAIDTERDVSHEQLNAHDAPLSVTQHSRPLPYSLNSDRVILLATELELQPWAVQVKAIPTATVPVVKILADPSRLPGAVSSVACGGEWMMQQHHMAAQAAAAAAGISAPAPPLGDQGTCHGRPCSSSESVTLGVHGTMGPGPTPQPCFHSPHTPPPWRGADVMNGLLSVDITFEGPEHGGIGSTAFSARVVQDACNETGFPPESTPAVQVTMVLKELLAQRRLNEPFSGGLSSYALLLLVVAVIKERTAIREEMERAERHQRAVAEGGGNNAVNDPVLNTTPQRSRSNSKQSCVHEKFDKENSVTDSSHKKLPNAEVRVSPDSSPIPLEHTVRPNVVCSKRSVRVGCKGAKERRKSSSAGSTRGTSRSTIEADSLVSVINSASSPGSSWASVAKKNSTKKSSTLGKASASVGSKSLYSRKEQDEPLQSGKFNTFADAVGSSPSPITPVASRSKRRACENKTRPVDSVETSAGDPKDSMGSDVCPMLDLASSRDPRPCISPTGDATEFLTRHREAAVDRNSHLASKSTLLPNSMSTGLVSGASLFPQGSNDVLEVLCSGETTAGKLLMHFLLFYGQLFESQTTMIDVSGKHHPDFHRLESNQKIQHVHISPFVSRRTGGTIDPVTGMLTVDPIVVYDPLEGAENNNVARSCFAWSSIRWVFAQSYMTLSSAVERSGPASNASGARARRGSVSLNLMHSREESKGGGCGDIGSSVREERSQLPVDAVSPLLELLLSF